MKIIYIHYTILDTLEIPDELSNEEVHKIVNQRAVDLGIGDIVNDIDYSYKI